MKRFRAALMKGDETEGTAVAMPFDVQQEFGTRGRVPVCGMINGSAFRNTLSPYRGVHHLPVNKALREGAKAKAGDMVSVVLERDNEPRRVTPPPDFDRALKANKAALAAWEKLSYSHRKESVGAIQEARKPETRARRIQKAIEELTMKKHK